MGIHTIRSIGTVVAKNLGKENESQYTGHCWRRSSATQAANNGANTTDLMRLYGWKQPQTAMKYLDATDDQAFKMANLVTGATCTKEKPATATSEEIAIGKGKENVVYNITVASGATLSIRN